MKKNLRVFLVVKKKLPSLFEVLRFCLGSPFSDLAVILPL